jgi:hypothetical protein
VATSVAANNHILTVYSSVIPHSVGDGSFGALTAVTVTVIMATIH